MDTASTMLNIFAGFSSIAALTWFFSSRPRLYLLVFVPRHERRRVARLAFRDDFRKGMRWMAALQFTGACVFGAIGLGLRFRQ